MTALAKIKTCSRCQTSKVSSLFHRDKTKQDGLCTVCKDCKKDTANLFYLKNRDDVLTRSKSKYSEDPEKLRFNAWKCVIKRNFSMSVDDYNQMFADQNGRCNICNRHQTDLRIRLAVDHCHNSGKVRGLLCDPCNRGIGMFKESEDRLLSAVNYIRSHK